MNLDDMTTVDARQAQSLSAAARSHGLTESRASVFEEIKHVIQHGGTVANLSIYTVFDHADKAYFESLGYTVELLNSLPDRPPWEQHLPAWRLSWPE